jgi:hypothetical protein
VEKETRLSIATAKTEKRAEEKVKKEAVERVFKDEFIFTDLLSSRPDK